MNPRVDTWPASGAPAPARHEIRRERLLRILDRHRQRRLVLLLAPAGFGKTTLAAEYARERSSPVIWLTMRIGDADPRNLFARLQRTFGAVCGDGALPSLGAGLAEGADGSHLARLLLADLERLPCGCIVVLDDYHLVQDAEEVQQGIDLLLRGLPAGAQILIAAREPPPISIQGLVVDQQVLVLGPQELRFTPEETSILRRQLGGDASQDVYAEGWVAGILLGGAPRQLGAADGSLVDTYVQREVLARLTTNGRLWLEALALIETITPERAARLLGPGPWPSRLAILASQCPFLVPDEAGVYRLHGLVREALMRRVRRGNAARARRLWTAVRTLAEEAGDTAGAVNACSELGETEAAIALVSRTVADAISAGRWTPALAALALLPEGLRRDHADLALAEAHALVQSGRPAQARQVAEAALEASGRSGCVRAQVLALVELANVARYAGDVDAATDWLTAADHLLPAARMIDRERRLVEGRLLGLRAVCCAVAGQVQLARDTLESAERVLLPEGTSRELAVVQFNLGALCVRTGDYQAARTELAASSTQWRVLHDRGMLATTQVILANLHLRTGDLDAAAASVARAIDAARLAGALRTEGHALTTLGALQRGYGRLTEAAATLDMAIRTAEEVAERELLVRSLTHRAEVAVLGADLLVARALLERAHSEVQRLESRVERAIVSRALGRLLLSEQATQPAIDAFEIALGDGEDAWGPDEKLVALYWLGTAHLQAGHVHQAHAAARRALGLAAQIDGHAVLAGPVAEDGRLLDLARADGLEVAALARIARLAACRQTWSGGAARVEPNQARAHGSRLEVRLFGTLLVHVDGQVMPPGGKRDRARELLALLALHPEGMPAVEIANVLYPELEPERAQHNVRMAVYLLRRVLGGKASVRHATMTYALAPQLDIWVDTRAFDACLQRARSAIGGQAYAALEEAIELYRGPLLADTGWAWVEMLRQSYAERAIDAELRLSELARSAERRRARPSLLRAI